MKQRSILKQVLYGLIALPINILATVLCILHVANYRAKNRSISIHNKLEYLEKGNK